MLLRRRRTLRIASVLGFLVVVAALMAYSQAGGGERGNGGGGGSPAAELPCPKVDAAEVDPPAFDSAPDVSLQNGVDYAAVLHTSCGDIAIDLREDIAPRTVANFVFLVEEGFFDGLTWHRIERDFVIQTGDPDGIIGSEQDGPGYTIPDELPDTGRDYVYGTVAMANDGPGTGGSQFFIVVHDPEEMEEQAGIEPEYSIFGRVSPDSYETLDKIARMPVRASEELPIPIYPRSPVVIESVEITNS